MTDESQWYENEEAIPLVKAKYLFASEPTLSTLKRWRRKGVSGEKLESFRSGGVWMTTREACRRFMRKLNEEK